MTEHVADVAPAAQTGGGHRTSPLLIARSVAALVLVAAMIVGWLVSQRETRAGIFYEGYEGGVTTGHDHWRVGAPISVGMSYVNPGDLARPTPVVNVHVLSAVPHVAVNTADATLKVSACSIDRSNRIGGIGVVASLHPSCSQVVPADGARLRVSGKVPEQLVLTMTPTRPGRVIVQGIDLVYLFDGHLIAQQIGLTTQIVVPG